MGSIRRKAHQLPQHTQQRSAFQRAMDESSGKGSMMQAHRSSGFVMDIAAFKVSHSVGVDKDTTALQAKKWSAERSIGRWRKCCRRLRTQNENRNSPCVFAAAGYRRHTGSPGALCSQRCSSLRATRLAHHLYIRNAEVWTPTPRAVLKLTPRGSHDEGIPL